MAPSFDETDLDEIKRRVLAYPDLVAALKGILAGASRGRAEQLLRDLGEAE